MCYKDCIRIALLQLPSPKDPKSALENATREILAAAEQGADLAVLPEMFCCPYDVKKFPEYAEQIHGNIVKTLSEAAKRAGIYLIGGSFPERDGDKLYNTAPIFDRGGNLLGIHRKYHLFDVDIAGGQHFRESEVLTPGDKYTVVDTEWGKIGICICFDIRFPEQTRAMADKGARIVIVPAAFNPTTGPLHWELLFRARAVDQQIYTVGVSPAPDHTSDYIAYGHSIAVDPWGRVLADLGTEPTTKILELDLSETTKVRQQIPLLRM